jgi:uncharacterized membrane protein YidH (DUF202 family)
MELRSWRPQNVAATNYAVLLESLQVMKDGKLRSHSEFYDLLDKTHSAVNRSAEERIAILEGLAATGNRNSIKLHEILDLYQFVCKNEADLRRIIYVHDSMCPLASLYPAYRWKLESNYVSRLLALLQANVWMQYQPFSLKVPSSAPKSPSFGSQKNPLYTSLMEPEDHEDPVPQYEFGKDDSYNVMHTRFFSSQTASLQLYNNYWIQNSDFPAVLKQLLNYCTPVDTFVGYTAVQPWAQVTTTYLDSIGREEYTNSLKDKSYRFIVLHTVKSVPDRVIVELKSRQDDEMLHMKDHNAHNCLYLQESEVVSFLNGGAASVPDSRVSLKNEIQKLIADRRLYPVLRVEANRICFSSSDSDSYKVLIDFNRRYYQERIKHMEWRTPPTRYLVGDSLLPSFAIVKVKFSQDQGAAEQRKLCISEMIKNLVLVRLEDFSDSLNAAYGFNSCEQLRHPLVKPPWWDAVAGNTVPPETADDTGDSKKPTDEEDEDEELNPMIIFSSDRTFLHWYNSAVLLSSIGISLNLISGRTHVGVVLVVIGSMLMVYMLWKERSRREMLVRREGHLINYYEVIAPTTLSFTIIIVFLVALFATHDTVKKFDF